MVVRGSGDRAVGGNDRWCAASAWPRDALLWAVVLVFIAVNAGYVPATRYMSPMLFVMMFYTAVALEGRVGFVGRVGRVAGNR
ncbi:MAG TPA: hypothetical protein VFO48_07990 [Vicinamibacterales bacterium]|nr:hypothetical protein [Vicinamibacterales bacterium]